MMAVGSDGLDEKKAGGVDGPAFDVWVSNKELLLKSFSYSSESN